jgi:hypothetical protein
MPGLLDRTAGSIVTPHGEILDRPATLIGADAAAILRTYFVWALRAQLEPEYVCATCYDYTRSSKAVYQITDDEITIICACSIRYFKGASLLPPRLEPSTSVKTDTTGVIDVALSDEEARLLRLYKKVLIELGLKEALRCNACYALNQPDGCMAQVMPMFVSIVCRCSNRTYAGMTI